MNRIRMGFVSGGLAVALALIVSLQPAGAARPSTGRWNLATGLCGTVRSLAWQEGTNNVFAAVQSINLTCSGVFRSTNGGQSFGKVGITNPGFSPPRVHEVSTGPGSIIYAATDQGVWTTRSLNQVTWTQRLGGLPNFTDIYQVQPVGGTTVVYATVDPMALNNNGGLWKSLDEGVSWTHVKPFLDAVSVTWGVGCPGQASTTHVAAARSDRGGLAGALWVSRDDGATWSPVVSYPSGAARDVSFECSTSFQNPAFGHLFVTNGDPGGSAAVYRSTDLAQTFVTDDNGFPVCCASEINPTSRTSFPIGHYVGTWHPLASQGSGMMTRGVRPKIGARWNQYTMTGLPPGAVIEDWVLANSPASGTQRFVALVGGGVYYFEP